MTAVARAGAAALALLLAAQPLGATQDGDGAGYRKWLYAALGAVVFSVPAMVSEAMPKELGACTSKECVTVLAAMAGASVGFLIGHEHDRAAARRYTPGPALHLRPTAVDLSVLPVQVVAGRDGAIVVGREGLSLVGRDGSVRAVGGELRGIAAAARLVERDAILAVTGSGVFAFGLAAGQAAGRRIFETGGETMAPVGDDAVVIGGSDVLRRLALSGRGAEIQARETARTAQPGVLMDLTWAPVSGVLWVLSRDRVSAREPLELTEISTLLMPGEGRRLSVSGTRGIVAAGRDGAYLLELGDAANPRIAARIQGMSFAYDAALDGDRAYVAAGPQGLVILDVRNAEHPAVAGVARNLGFVSAVAPAGPVLYTIDRENRRVNVIELEATARAERR